MGSSARARIITALVLCLAGAAVSGVLLLQHHGEPSVVTAVNEACGDGRTSGCAEVARSAWSSLAGIPWAAYGLVFYLALSFALVLALVGPADLRDPLAGTVAGLLAAGLLADLFLLGVQVFALKAYCTLCISTYLLSAATLALLFPARRALRGLGAALKRPDCRLAAGGWALASLAAITAVLAVNLVFACRAAERQAHLLGQPAPPTTATPTPSAAATPALEIKVPAPSPSGPQDAKFWRERAQTLQQTLDDPAKLEAYFTEKARREFDAAEKVSIDLDDAGVKGPVAAPVKVVEYSDFLCPFCRNLALGLSQFIPQAGNRVVVYFKNYPLDAACNGKLKHSTHPGACNLALGAVCAHRQGKFEAYHDRAFATELRNPQPADVARLAGEAGLNAAALQGCMSDPQTKATLQAQIDEANRLGVTATPTLYVDGKKLPRINDFVAIVDKEAQKKGMPPLGK